MRSVELEEKADGGIVETIKTVFWALLIAGVFRTLFFQPFFIPSGSMKDTLLVGDFLFVNKMAYGYSQYSCPLSACPIDGRIFGAMPERGDVVVFRHPTNGQDYIKRLIGLPGDRVQLKNGIVHINGEAAPQVPDGTFVEPRGPQGSQNRSPVCQPDIVECIKTRYIETLPGGVSHAVLDVAPGYTDNTLVFTVPEGEFFFMGDNRDNSTDSRVSLNQGGVGFVSFDRLIGRADRIMFSSAGKRIFYFWTWRSDRYFKAVE